MDEHEIEEQSEEEPQESMMESTEAQQTAQEDLTRDTESVSSDETEQPVKIEPVVESSVSEPESETAPVNR